MNNKGTSIKSYIVLVVLLLGALVFIFYFLDSEKDNRKAKPMRDNKIEEVLEKEKTTTKSSINNKEEGNVLINMETVSNFSSSLSEIIEDLVFINDYSVTKFYHGVEFNFNCTNFDVENKMCLEGSALMKIDNALYPLFTYSNESENYLNRADDYYIILLDDIVILYTSNSGSSVESARIFDREASSIATLKNTLTSYKYEGKLYKRMYPNIEDNKMYYYTCTNSQVTIKYVDLDNIGDEEILERVEGSCY